MCTYEWLKTKNGFEQSFCWTCNINKNYVLKINTATLHYCVLCHGTRLKLQARRQLLIGMWLWFIISLGVTILSSPFFISNHSYCTLVLLSSPWIMLNQLRRIPKIDFNIRKHFTKRSVDIYTVEWMTRRNWFVWKEREKQWKILGINAEYQNCQRGRFFNWQKRISSQSVFIQIYHTNHHLMRKFSSVF